jgi:hypothetical protein
LANRAFVASELADRRDATVLANIIEAAYRAAIAGIERVPTGA